VKGSIPINIVYYGIDFGLDDFVSCYLCLSKSSTSSYWIGYSFDCFGIDSFVDWIDSSSC